jgi:hypothetical protein
VRLLHAGGRPFGRRGVERGAKELRAPPGLLQSARPGYGPPQTGELPGHCSSSPRSTPPPPQPTPQYYSNCIVFAANMQKTKIQAIATALDVLTQMEAQLNTDMATKIAAFNVVHGSGWGAGAALARGQLALRAKPPRACCPRLACCAHLLCPPPHPLRAALHERTRRQLGVRGRRRPDDRDPRGRSQEQQRGVRGQGQERAGQGQRLCRGPLGGEPLVAADQGRAAAGARGPLPHREAVDAEAGPARPRAPCQPSLPTLCPPICAAFCGPPFVHCSIERCPAKHLLPQAPLP